MKVIIHVKGKEIAIPCKIYFSKKFQGIGVLFDCDPVQGFLYKEVLIVKFKLLFVGGWLTVGIKNKSYERLNTIFRLDAEEFLKKFPQG